MKYGWIVYNGSLPGDKFLDFAEWLQKAAFRAGSHADIIRNNDLLAVTGSAGLELLSPLGLQRPDYCLFTDKDLHLARQLEHLGIPLFNSSYAIETSDDKIATHQVLAKRKIPMPRTITAPKTFLQDSPLEEEQLKIVADTLGFPMIVKEAFGSFGQQVYLVSNFEELQEQVRKIGGKPFLFQEFIKTSHGIDLRLQVAGDQVIAAVKRTAVDDFRANVTNGGKMHSYEPTDAECQLAIAAARALDCDFAGVDLLYGEKEPLVCEVNSNAHIHNLYDATGIDASDAIVLDVLAKIEKGRKSL